jgi:hypothetical protein
MSVHLANGSLPETASYYVRVTLVMTVGRSSKIVYAGMAMKNVP